MDVLSQVGRIRGMLGMAPIRMLLTVLYTDKLTVGFPFHCVSTLLMIPTRPLWIWNLVGFVYDSQCCNN